MTPGNQIEPGEAGGNAGAPRFAFNLQASIASCDIHSCPCEFYGDPMRMPAIIQQDFGEISGPLLDRIDIQIEVLQQRFSPHSA